MTLRSMGSEVERCADALLLSLRGCVDLLQEYPAGVDSPAAGDIFHNRGCPSLSEPPEIVVGNLHGIDEPLPGEHEEE